MNSSEKYAELRRQFTDEWIKVGDCPIRYCTQDCCIGLENLLDRFGVRQEHPEEISHSSPKRYHLTERLLASLPESKVFDWKITFAVFNDLRQHRAWEQHDPLEGYMEIPELMAEILKRLDWPEGFRRMTEQLPSTNRKPLHKWFVQAFVDVLFPDSLLHHLNASQEPVHSANDGEVALIQGWLNASPDAASNMLETLNSEGIDLPKVPRWLEHQLREHGDGWVWGTEPALNPWVVYSLFDEVALFDKDAPRPIEQMLSSTQPDFWLAGQRGHGVNSYGFGVVSRIGPLFVAHQHGWGGAYMDAVRATAIVNSGIDAWNATLDAGAGSINESLRVAVVYSDYRAYAEIWVHGDAPVPDSSEPLVLAPSGWTALWKATRENDIAELWDLHQHDDIVVAIAAGHLTSLLADRELQGRAGE